MLDEAIKYGRNKYQLALERRAFLHRFYSQRPDLAFLDYRMAHRHLPSAYHLLAKVGHVQLFCTPMCGLLELMLRSAHAALPV